MSSPDEPAQLPQRLRRVGRQMGSTAVGLRRRWAAGRPLRRLDERLVREPVFVLCASRSGSTLLRSMLNTHSQIYAPHELQFHALQVTSRFKWAYPAWNQLGLSVEDMEAILWDRLLYSLLSTSGKRIIVDKTPQNSSSWQRIHKFWPRARYLHLRRHPAAILASRFKANPDWRRERNIKVMLDYGSQLDAARAALPGLTVRYEELTADPATVMRGVCDYLRVPFEESMLRYRVPHRSEQLNRVGDWSTSLRTGRVQPPKAVPTDVPDEIRPMIESWGYA